ncbi:MAG: GLUG motif-containing protein [Gallionella sp.]
MRIRNTNRQSQSKFQFRLKPAYAAVLLAFSVHSVQANPFDPAVVSGQASFASSGSTLTVTNTPGTIINWQGFSIGSNEITRFNQQSASSAVLNRVISSNPSSILGTLQSNGRVFLINPNGIVFGAGAVVDVAGLVASSLKLSDADFLAGRNNYTQVPGAQKVSNAGNINAQQGGQIYLIAPDVENTGVITAPGGEILLAAGHSVDLVSTGDPNLRVNITAPAGDATNVGQLIASSGSLGLFGTVVRNSGTVSADSATLQGGRIVFKASLRAEIGGTVSATGTTGGTIQALGNEVQITAGATLDASGTNGGGTVLVGGDKQGANPNVLNAQNTYVDANATIKADATQNGDGGKVIVWADKVTRAFGSISARGGMNGGNGGFVETSAHYLDVAGIRVDASARNGDAGMWLLDPLNVIIDSATVDTGGTFIGGVWTPNASGSYISTGTIVGALSGGTSVTITTANTGFSEAGDINVNASIVKAGTPTATLTLLAENNINFAAGAGVSSSIGVLNLVLHSDSDGSGVGTVTFAGTNAFALNGGRADIYYNPVSYTDAATKSDSLSNPYSGIFTPTPYTAWMLVNDAGLETAGTLGLQAMNTNLAGNYALGKNIDATGTSVWNLGAGFEPVGTISTPFTGTFDGLGHTINALFINRPSTDYVGLFGRTNASTVKNVSLTNVNISGNSYVGSLVGWHQGNLAFSNNATGTVTGTMDAASLSGNHIGGLVGINYDFSTIDNCSSGSTVSGDNYVGGLVGTNQRSTLSNSSATGNVTGTQFYAGGLVGDSYYSVISNGIASGNVIGVSYVGGLVGRNGYSSNITSSSATGNVSGTQDVGGLAGFNGSQVTGSSASGAVTGTTNVGGLVGNNYWINGTTFYAYSYGVISSSSSTGTVSGSTNVGGLAGYSGAGSGINSNSFASGDVTGNSNVGGLVGYSYGTAISDSHASGNVIGSGASINSLGGLVGAIDYNGSITNSYATGSSVAGTGAASVGGLVGVIGWGSVDNSYASVASVSGGNGVGGLVGNSSSAGSISNSYVSLGGVTGTSNYGGLVGINTGTLTNSHYNINGVSINGASIVGTSVVTLGGLFDDNAASFNLVGQYTDWLVTGSKSLNILNYTSPYGSFGSVVANNYTISNTQGLKDMLGFADNSLYTFTLAGNIDLTGMAGFYVPLLASSFDGAGFTVSNFNLNLPSTNSGLFGRVLSSSTVSNLALVGATVNGGSSNNVVNVGALAGLNEGTINNVHVSGTVSVTGANNVGGLVGALDNFGSISNSSVTGAVTVTGVNAVGGLVGNSIYYLGSINNSHVTGATVAGATAVGGLVGNNTGTITGSYVSSGAVTATVRSIGGLVGNDGGTRTNSFFNIDTVTTNGGNNVTVGGLYATQYTDWFNGGLLTPLVIGNYTSLMLQVDGSYGINSLLGMKDMLGFADDPAVYNFSLTGSIDLVSLPGFYVPKLAGSFNGNNFTLSNLNLTLPNYDMGLFGVTSANSLVSNIGLLNANVSGYGAVGALAGRNFGNIDKASVTGTSSVFGVSGIVGGLVGQNNGGGFTTSGVLASGNIINSFVNGGTVSSNSSDVGGLVGNNNRGNIDLSSVDSTSVTGTSNVGGLVGNNQGYATFSSGALSGNITNSYVTNGSVTSTGGLLGKGIGGLVGWNIDGDIIGSHVLNPNVTGGSASEVGGLVGHNKGGFNSVYQGPSTPYLNVYFGKISNSYVNGGTVTSTGNDVGGLVGSNFGALIEFSHVDSIIVTGNLNVGGLVGNDSGEGWSGGVGKVSDSYALNTQVMGESKIGGLIGNVAAPITFNSSDNFDSVINSYVSGGTVTSNATSSALATGVGGLVGYNSFGNINGSYVTNGTVVNGGSASNVGGLAGYNIGSSSGPSSSLVRHGLISASYVNGGTVSGSSSVGGLVGNNTGSISNTYVSGVTVSGSSSIGGLVGNNIGTISNSYVSTGSLSGGTLGGVVGWNSGTVSNTFWDTAMPGVSFGIGYDAVALAGSNAGATGLDAVGMTTMSNFASAGWDIAKPGGVKSVWRIYEGYTAPLLSIFLKPLNITADPVSKAYDGLAYSGGLVNPVYTPGNPNLVHVLGSAYGVNDINAGTYAPALYSDQQGYDLTFVGGDLTITTASVTLLSVNANEIVNTTLMFGPDSGSAQSTSTTDKKDKLAEEIIAAAETEQAGGTAAAPLPVCR